MKTALIIIRSELQFDCLALCRRMFQHRHRGMVSVHPLGKERAVLHRLFLPFFTLPAGYGLGYLKVILHFVLPGKQPAGIASRLSR